MLLFEYLFIYKRDIKKSQIVNEVLKPLIEENKPFFIDKDEKYISYKRKNNKEFKKLFKYIIKGESMYQENYILYRGKREDIRRK